jgi:hypothetical protein
MGIMQFKKGTKGADAYFYVSDKALEDITTKTPMEKKAVKDHRLYISTFSTVKKAADAGWRAYGDDLGQREMALLEAVVTSALPAGLRRDIADAGESVWNAYLEMSSLLDKKEMTSGPEGLFEYFKQNLKLTGKEVSEAQVFASMKELLDRDLEIVASQLWECSRAASSKDGGRV